MKPAKKINSKQKGNRGERAAIEAVCELLGREPGPQDRRNCQATAWGGLGNPDIRIQGLESFHFEVKNTATFSFGAWTKKLLADCPVFEIPVLLYQQPRNGFWVLHRLSDHNRYVAAWADAMGWRQDG